METFAEAEEVGAEEVPVALPVLLTVAKPEVDDEEEEPHFPKRGLQPVPQ